MKNTVVSKHISKAIVAISLVALPANMAWAEESQGGGGFADLIPLVLIMAIFWYFLIRPQQKRLKAHAELIQAIKKGDKIITAGGLFGKVMDVKEDHLKVEIAEGVRVKVKQDTVQGLVSPEKTEG